MRKIFTSIFILVLCISLAFGQLPGSKSKGSKGGTIINSNGGANKIDVWDFGAAQLDTAIYMNNLDSATINSWYAPTITVGSSGNVLPGFTAGLLQWVGGSNDRLRTTNLGLTRYDQNIASVTGYTGRVYVNAGASITRYMSLTLNEDDEVTIVEKTDAGGVINFQYVADPGAQTDAVAVTSNLDTLGFVAKAAGVYHIFDNSGKPSYFRIYRKDAVYTTINGTVDITNAAGIPDGYGISLTNSAGKTWNSVVSADAFTITVPVGYTYTLSLSDANGYIITNGKTLAVSESTTTYNVELLKVDLFTLSGAITGLDPAELAKLTLAYTPDPVANKIYVPEPIIDAAAATYAVLLEADCKYTISAKGLNDYYISTDTITIGDADATSDLAFLPKPAYNITINTTGLTAEQLALLSLTFTNLNEPGYSYNFSSVAGITLRDGTYSIAYSGLDDFPVQMGLTSNLTVAGADGSKTLAFEPVTVWSFDDKAIVNGATSYKGLLFTGNIASELAKGHLTAKPGATIRVPVNVGDKMKITYYYSAAFSINSGDTTTTSSGSTSIFESVEHVYTGTEAGYDTIKVVVGASTSYITEISVAKKVDYSPVIYVGTDKEFKTVNEALAAIDQMDRSATDRVTVMIDPGNYEEMLVVTSPNVTLKNAATTPDIALANKGVDISANAVRITSYYGHGYSYYSMGNNQKWNADVLRVNKENGHLSYANAGAGTTNGSYWNAGVVISANGFEAEDIIFENSFNQYISKKESEDVVVMWEVGNKGLRPTDIGNTGVQNRSFVERAAAIAITNNTDKVVLTNCRVIGRQDAFYGGTGTRVVVNKGAVMGAVDYIFGGMTAVFYKTDLVMNTSDESVDAAYLTAAQQSSGRGYLMYKCAIKSATPGTETASAFLAKPGYFGRPWQATTSEVVFFNTTIYTSDFTGFEGKSLISPSGWSNSLGGESNLMYEYGTFEFSGEDNSSSRAAWSTVLTTPILTDGTEITTFNFTKGTDNWDPIPVEEDIFSVSTNTLTIAPQDNSTKTFDITSNVSWKVASDQDWLSVSSDYGVDNSTITLTAAENTTLVERTANITVSGNGVASQTITVTQEAGTTGINEKTDKPFKVFPNPTTSIMTINNFNKGAIISIYDVNGILLINETAKEKIDVSSLAKGVYSLKIADSKSIKMIKFIKQ
ncbi:MAG: pectinesterase family protein [Lentimicrobiaceae bacterium]|jgi:pectin methylesterase-like acyl-CoA thioesterase